VSVSAITLPAVSCRPLTHRCLLHLLEGRGCSRLHNLGSHGAKCSNGAVMTGFKFEAIFVDVEDPNDPYDYSDSPPHMRLRYTCHRPPAAWWPPVSAWVNPSTTAHNIFATANSAKLRGLMAHDVRCPPQHVMLGFRFHAPTADTFRVSFLCVPAAGLTCSTYSSPVGFINEGAPITDLIFAQVNCPNSGSMLAQWKVAANLEQGVSGWHYSFTCCQ